MIHILVKNYGVEGLTVHGATDDEAVAQAWESASSDCRRIEVDTMASINPQRIAISERL